MSAYTKQNWGGLIWALLLIVVGISLALYSIYFGVVVCFIGGIVDIINQIKAPETSAVVVAWAIAKILLAETVAGVGVLCGILITYLGIHIGADS